MSDPAAQGQQAPQPPLERLISVLIVLGGAALFLCLPFILREGADIFLPLTAAFVLSFILAPLADYLVRKRLPNWLASLLAIATPVLMAAAALYIVVRPAIGMAGDFADMSSRISSRARGLSLILRQFERTAVSIVPGGGQTHAREVVIASPSLIERAAFATPHMFVQILIVVLLAYFMLAARQNMKRNLLFGRMDFGHSLRASMVLRQAQEQLSDYIRTVLAIALGVGVIVGVGAWAFGWKNPAMWGGMAALLNLVPYVGPMTMMGLLGFYGLGNPGSLPLALAPALSYIGLHAVESNVVTPIILGHRLSTGPVAVLAGIVYFGWVWGIPGALLAMPIVLILSAMMAHAGRPNLVGFILGEPLFPRHGAVANDQT